MPFGFFRIVDPLFEITVVIAVRRRYRVVVADQAVAVQYLVENFIPVDRQFQRHAHVIVVKGCEVGAHREGVMLGADDIQDFQTLITRKQVGGAGIDVADDIDYAERVIAAFDEAVADGRGVVTVDGRMIENLHVENARRILAVADAIAARG